MYWDTLSSNNEFCTYGNKVICFQDKIKISYCRFKIKIFKI